MTTRLLAVGGAAPGLRLAAADIAAAWGRAGGRGQTAVCAPDEDTLTLAWQAGASALRAADVDAADGARLGENHRAAGRPLGERVVADLQAAHGGQRGVRRVRLPAEVRGCRDGDGQCGDPNAHSSLLGCSIVERHRRMQE